MLAENTLCGAKPDEGAVTTTLYLDRDYVTDQVYWQHATHFRDRFAASRFIETSYAGPLQVARIGERQARVLSPWLDELASLTVNGISPERFYRAQSLLSATLDVVIPRMKMMGRRVPPEPRGTTTWSRAFRPLREEAQRVAELLDDDLSRGWSVTELAARVHLSPSQLRRVFVEAFGKSPSAYRTMLRAERMAHLLKTTNSPISSIAAAVGWRDPDFAARQFRRSVGVSPSDYRRFGRNRDSRCDPE